MDVEELLSRCRAGDRGAENELIAIYLEKIARYADHRIGPDFVRRFDGEDVAQSVLKSAALGMRTGGIEVEDERMFWGLLVVMTKHKINRRVRYWRRQRRDIRREERVPEQAALPEEILRDLVQEPNEQDAEEATKLLNALLVRLESERVANPPSYREVLMARLNGDSYETICDRCEKQYGRPVSTKTIQRRMDVIREIFEQCVEDEKESED